MRINTCRMRSLSSFWWRKKLTRYLNNNRTSFRPQKEKKKGCLLYHRNPLTLRIMSHPKWTFMGSTYSPKRSPRSLNPVISNCQFLQDPWDQPPIYRVADTQQLLSQQPMEMICHQLHLLLVIPTSWVRGTSRSLSGGLAHRNDK